MVVVKSVVMVGAQDVTGVPGLTNTLGATLWTGLNSLEADSGWGWSNGNPFRYLNWAPGE